MSRSGEDWIDLCNYDRGKIHAVGGRQEWSTACNSFLVSDMPWQHRGPTAAVDCQLCLRELKRKAVILSSQETVK